MAWLYLVGAGILEIGWALSLKYAEGFTKLWPSIITIVLMAFSFLMLSEALKTIPLGTAYAIWTGIGAVGTAVVGMLLFSEPRDLIRIGCVLLVVAGIVGLKLTSSGH